MTHTFIDNLTLTELKEFVRSDGFVVFSKTTCPYCVRVKKTMSDSGYDAKIFELDKSAIGSEIQSKLYDMTGQRTVPNIFVNGQHIGGCDSFHKLLSNGELVKLIDASKNLKKLRESTDSYDYDLVVIGGGSGGLSCAKQAAKYGAKVAVFDFVKPSPMNTKWGLGGTCVNVGCIPKKLMHQAAIHGEYLRKNAFFGWKQQEGSKSTHDWEEMQNNITNYIRKLNFGYLTSLRSANVTYLNEYARIESPHTIISVNRKNEAKKYTAKYIVVCTGERPSLDPKVPGCAEYCISSDDLFWMKSPPGKTLVVGASYVALECAGALHSLGYDVTVMVRSILLRGFDQEMAEKIGDYMKNLGIKFLREYVPIKIEPVDPKDSTPFVKPKEVTVHFKKTSATGVTENLTEKFETVIFAIGRESCTKEVGLTQLGVSLDSRNRVIGYADRELTSAPGVFAVGDILAGKPQLTPMAIQSGEMLADRLFSDSIMTECDYNNVPTTIFTPLEYSCVGYSEEGAIEAFGESEINVYHNIFTPLEESIVEDGYTDSYYAKVIVRNSLSEKVIGIHYAGPNAGEIMQGLAVAIRAGITIKDLQHTVGIHPTCAEIFTTLKVTKKSNKPLVITGC